MITLSLPSITIPHMIAFACVCLLLFVGRGIVKALVKIALKHGRERSKSLFPIALFVALLFSILCMFNPAPGTEAAEGVFALKIVLGIFTVVAYSMILLIPKPPY